MKVFCWYRFVSSRISMGRTVRPRRPIDSRTAGHVFDNVACIGKNQETVHQTTIYHRKNDNMKKRFFPTITVLLMIMFLASCTKPADPVETVKGMIMDDYPTTTIGKAFDSAFNNPVWKSFKTEKGQTVVEFNGNVKQSMHDGISKFLWHRVETDKRIAKFFDRDMMEKIGLEKMKELVQNHPNAKQPDFDPLKMLIQYYIDQYYTPTGAPVEFQWVMNIKDPAKASLERYACGDSWKELELEPVLNMIYH